jgi:hypothetical protein
VRDRNKEEDTLQAMILSSRSRWCGRDGPIPWPANSPDLTPPDFFVWVYVKSLVYGQRPQNEAGFRQKTTAAIAHITPEMLRATCYNLSVRYELCRVPVAVMLSVNKLMCWNTKVVSLLHVYVSLTGNKVDSLLQRFVSFCDISKGSPCITGITPQQFSVFSISECLSVFK